MKKLILLLLFPVFMHSQVGVNTTAPNAMMDVSSTNSGFLIPRIALTSATDVTTVVNPQGGPLAVSTLIYNTATAGAAPNDVVPGFYYWNGTRWMGLGQTPGWQLGGNAGTSAPFWPATYGTTPIDAGENYLGTTDAQDLVLATNSRERMRINRNTGNIGIGTATPTARLSVDEAAGGATAIEGTNTNTSAMDGAGVVGTSINADGYGVGGRFFGGFHGVHAINLGHTYPGISYGIYSSSTGTAGTRVGGYFTATGGTNNYSLITPPNGGFAGIGTVTPSHRLHVVQPTTGTRALHAENTAVATSDGTGIFGRSVNNPGYGYGGQFEGGYHGIRVQNPATNYSGTSYGIYASSTGTAGARYAGYFDASGVGTGNRIGGYFTASGGATNLAIHANGRVRISDGTQGAGRVLTSDATGIASWQLPGANNIAGFIGNGINIPYTQTGAYTYTGSNITLPPGRYAVQVVMLLAPLGAPGGVSPVNSSFWVRSTFTDATGSTTPSPDIIGSPLISGNLSPSSSYGLVTGLIIINNATAGNKTYYYKAGHVVAHNTTYSMAAFGGGWNEDSIVAIRLN
jgi:hypothetical protein